MNLSKTLLLKQTPLVVSLIGVAFSPALFRYSSLSPVQGTSATLAANTTALYKQVEIKQLKVSSGLPVRLKIPKINVDAPIDPMGLLSNGDMEAPSGPRNVGWFKFGPRPGNNGTAVIDGHYGRWKNGESSVFDNLNKLNVGDIIYVVDAQGATANFVVREFRTYDSNEDTPEVFGSSDGKAHLNLITCQGVWNKTQKSYSTRLVVFADKEVES